MIGLTNASLIVGAESVGSTLWQIRDDLTVRLISRFYDGLLQKRDVPSALREAQLEGSSLSGDPTPRVLGCFQDHWEGLQPAVRKRRANSPLDVPPRPSTGSPG